MTSCLEYELEAKCSKSKARAGILKLPHAVVLTPVFMPVGTKGTLKGLLPEQLEKLGCRMMLSNTYHLANQPGEDILNVMGGLHKFMNWKYGLLTDSGGFQMVSLLKLAKVTEEGVTFKSTTDGSDLLLTPEKSIQVQNAIGADIIMQLDDVVASTMSGDRVKEAMLRSIRWLDRCIAANQNPESQSIFPIVQGGLDVKLRSQCAREMMKRDVRGFAIGGLSGGEAKDDFWRMVNVSTDILPQSKPRYLMGVGFAVDLVVCSALGCDMFDCVYPTRTARFGVALADEGSMQMKHKRYSKDTSPISSTCKCPTCLNYTRAYIHAVTSNEPVGCTLITIHNVAYQMDLMSRIRQSIIEDEFPQFVKRFMASAYPDKKYPKWIVEAMRSVSVDLHDSSDQSKNDNVK